MSDLTDFLLAQLAADEAAALAAYVSPWSADEQGHVWTGSDTDPDEGPTVYVNGGVYRNQNRTAAHIARHDPARVLADVEAKRAVIVLMEQIKEESSWYAAMKADDTLRTLAQPYRGADGWQAAWSE